MYYRMLSSSFRAQRPMSSYRVSLQVLHLSSSCRYNKVTHDNTWMPSPYMTRTLEPTKLIPHSYVYFQEESIATVIQSCVLGVLIFPRDRTPAQMSTPSGTLSNAFAPGEYLFRMSLPVRSTIRPSQAIAHDQLADRFHTLYLRRLR